MVSAEGERKKKREKKNLESHCSSPVLSIARTIRHPQAISSPRAGRRNVSPSEEKERGDIRFYIDRYPRRFLRSRLVGSTTDNTISCRSGDDASSVIGVVEVVADVSRWSRGTDMVLETT
ncbi:hypothetical protein B296_00046329 [Ensete ventricosum]|uniref:Uncharacterized protein n=1 Tax=Ensete ventricosum TaxID=4639 RepID=A0A426XU68_ENSVE|nr:hypothetical protein B296_00046329 [Ensete ventricosum]